MCENTQLLKLTAIIHKELNRIIFDIEDRKDILFKLWTKERLRSPLLRVLRNRYDDMKVEHLIYFPENLMEKIDEFYNFLDKFVFYISYTEDMPQTLEENFLLYTKELSSLAKTLNEELIIINPCLKDNIFEQVK